MADLERLTRREREVLKLIAQGLSIPEIAERLYRSQKTIESHRLSLGRKLGANNRVELTRIAIQAGLTPLDETSARQAEQQHKALRQQLAGHERAWEVLRSIDASLNAVTGYTFLHRLVAGLCNELSVVGAFVAEIAPDDDATLRNVMLFAAGELVEQQDIILLDTPCQATITDGMARFDAGVGTQFPYSKLAQDFNIDSYLGVRLNRAAGGPLGLLAIFDTSKLDDFCFPDLILQAYAARAAAELERAQTEEKLRQLSEQLEHRVEHRTRQLQRSNEKLQQRLAELAQTEADLRNSERQFRTLVETMRDGLAVIDPQGRITYTNPRFCEMLGWEPDQLVGVKAVELIADPKQAAWFVAQQPQRETDQMPQYRLRFKHRSGQIVDTIVSPRSLFDDDGTFRGSFGIMTEV